MSFQAAVGTWFAAHVVTGMPIGPRFGISPEARPADLQFETGDAVDDIVLRLSDGGAVYVQCKTRLSLDQSAGSPLARTIAQLVRLCAQARTRNVVHDSTRVAVVLAVAEDAPGSLNDLERGCRTFDTGGAWPQAVRRLAKKERAAIEVFAKHARREWRSATGSTLTNPELVEMLRLFRVRRFGEDQSSSDWREASRIVGARLFGGEERGRAPTQALLDAVRRAIRSGATANRQGLLRALRAAGHVATRAPDYDADVAKIVEYTGEECRRLARHTRLPVGAAGIPIARECLPGLRQAVDGGSLLVTGEPGAGKTGVLVGFARELTQRKSPFVFLSVERLVGVTTTADVSRELGISHPLVEVLSEWPGVDPGVLIIDALDASRGGPSELIIAALIDQAVAKLGDRWSVVASIRTFDLLNGRRFREIFAGTPPDTAFAEPGLQNIRHFRIPPLSDGELAELGIAHSGLGALVENAPLKLKGLLRNVFNLSIAADLVARGMRSDSLEALSTQSELIDRYEDERLASGRLKNCAAATIGAMVRDRRLTIRQTSIPNDAVDDVLASGVLVRAGDHVAFAHHVLFDHVAGRFHLSDRPELLREQVSGDPAIGLLLGPALRFALERVWSTDVSSGHLESWRTLSAITGATNTDPVVASTALRTMAERVEAVRDVDGLAELIRSGLDRDALGGLLSRLARFVGMSLPNKDSVAHGVALAWATVAGVAASTRERGFLDAVRILLLALFERGDFGDREFVGAFGAAARDLLASVWSLEVQVPLLATNAIRFVARSFGSDPVASRSLLQQVLEEPRFSAHAHEEAPWVAEGILHIIPHDSQFASVVFATLFGQDAPQDGTTWLGGHRSQILPMTSNRRQDYEHARWYLGRAIGPFLAADPKGGTTAVVGATLGRSSREAQPGDAPTILEVLCDGRTVQIADDMLSLQDWRSARSDGDPDESVLEAFVAFLESCDRDAFRDAVEVALAGVTPASVWARLIGVAATRPGLVDDMLWALVLEPRFVAIRGLARDAVTYLASIYPLRPLAERARFERSAVAPELSTEQVDRNWWESLLARFLSLVPEELLATDEMSALRRSLEKVGRLRGNPAFLTVSVGPAEGCVAEHLLAASGVDLERDPDRVIRERVRGLEASLSAPRQDESAERVAEIWRLTTAVVETIDTSTGGAPHAESLHSSWGEVSNAVERIARSAAYDPAAPGHPGINALIALARRMFLSPYPEAGVSGSDDPMSWGNRDVRVYAASSLMALARRYANERPDLLVDLQDVLVDPVASVRLQVAQSLNTLWDVAREPMWELVTTVVEHEEDLRVLGFLVAGPLRRIAGADSNRAELLLSRILRRVSAPQSGTMAHRGFAEAAGPLVGWLYVKEGNQNAWSWIARWTSDPRQSERLLGATLHSIRGALFLGYGNEATPADVAMQLRAQKVLEASVQGAVAALAAAEPLLRNLPSTGVQRESVEALHIAGARILEQCCNQLYFGSGAFERSTDGEGPGLNGDLQKRRFLADYRVVLEQIGVNGGAHTIHNLVQLYGYLADAAPETVFDRVAEVIVGSGAEGGYHLESLAADELVALIRRYLADHRAVFEVPKRREDLVRVLELFSSAGWPNALRLMYELPDLLR